MSKRQITPNQLNFIKYLKRVGVPLHKLSQFYDLPSTSINRAISCITYKDHYAPFENQDRTINLQLLREFYLNHEEELDKLTALLKQ